ncbi:MAG: hypothetical protein QT12_C0015G0009 [archaeon GW2011_AR21]|nr:MAG: hypothetical protein QT12_C0015G0009 [archaeon GW2011_AR21]
MGSSNNNFLILSGAVLAVVLIGAGFYFLSASAGPEDDRSKMTAFDILRTQSLKSEGKCAFCGTLGTNHEHADFKVYLNNEAINFNNPAYFVKSSYVHVESGENPAETGNVIHIHARNVPLWFFFESIGMSFKESCFGFNSQLYCSNSGNKLRLFVNGVENSQLGNYVPKNLDKILVSYGEDSDIGEQLQSITSYSARTALGD